MDAAAISAGQVPQDILDDEALAAKLPVIFRTIRGEKLTEEQLNLMTELMRSTHRAESDPLDPTPIGEKNNGKHSCHPLN